MEKKETNTANRNTAEPKESLARNFSRWYAFTGCSFATLTAIGAVLFALGLIGVVYFDNLVLEVICSVYGAFGVLFVLKASEIEKCYNEEFRP
jgi:hypothetical protein